jgi:hypothetical protein
LRTFLGRVGRLAVCGIAVLALWPAQAGASHGGYHLDFKAADPGAYQATTPPAACPPGRASDPLPGAQHATGLTSLAPEHLILGQVVPFEVLITVDPDAPADGTFQFSATWDTATTSGSDFGYADLLCAFVDTSDGSAAEIDQDANLTFVEETTPTEITGTFTVVGLDPDERVVVEIWLVLDASIPPDATGTVHARLIDEGGAQTIPLQPAEALQPPSKIVVAKLVAGGSDPAAAFQFTGDVQATLRHGQSTGLEVSPGQYVVSETVPPGWNQPAIACDDSDSSGSGAVATFNVGPAETVTCTFSNSQPPPTLTVVVDKTNDASGDGLFGDEETLVVDPATPGLSGNVTFRAAITNQSAADVVISELTDSFGNTTIEVCPSLVGTTLAAGASTVCQFTIQDYAPTSGASQLDTVTVRVSQAGNPANTASDADDSRVNFVKILPQAQLSLSVDKTNDANRDGVFTDRETHLGSSGDVSFRAVITNHSAVDIVLTSITDSFGTTRVAVCPELVRMVLGPGATVSCRFTILGYAPSQGSTQVDTVLVDAEERADSSNTTFGQDTSTVDFVRVSAVTPTTRPAVLPVTGSRLAGLGGLLLTLGTLALGVARLGERGRKVSSTDWL